MLTQGEKVYGGALDGMKAIGEIIAKAHAKGAIDYLDVRRYHEACIEVGRALAWAERWNWPTSWGMRDER